MELLVIDPHRESIDIDDPIFYINFVEHTVEFKNTIDRTNKVTHVTMSVESDEIGTQQSFENFWTFGKAAE